MKRLATALTLVAASTLTANVNAESTTGNASVTILSTITFVEDTVLAFGAIPSTDGVCTMDALGALTGTCSGTGTAGQFTVSGTANQGVSVSVGSGSTVDGVTLAPSLESSASPTLDGVGDTVVDVAGALTLSSATAGVKALTYTLTVNYN